MLTWSDGVVVITSASHAEGREFEPRSDLFAKKSFFYRLTSLRRTSIQSSPCAFSEEVNSVRKFLFFFKKKYQVLQVFQKHRDYTDFLFTIKQTFNHKGSQSDGCC